MPDFDASPYAAFVWPAYAVTALAFVWMVADSLIRARRWKNRADKDRK